jgi:glycosyltransferase involved in cell wall biosynthesis
MDSTPDAKPPLVSVIMMVLNGEPYITDQIDSILAQNYAHLELIICDDGSTDRTAEIVREYMRKDPRVRLAQNERNLGVSRTFQKHCHLCQGEFIAPTDHDDFWLPEKIGVLAAYFSQHPETDLAFTDSMICSKDLSTKSGSLQRKVFGNHSPGGPIPIDKLLECNMVPFHASMFRRTLLRRIVPIPDRFMYDIWTALVCSLNHPLGYVNQCLDLYRQHGKNMVGTQARGLVFFLKHLNDREYLQGHYDAKVELLTIYQKLLDLGGSAAAQHSLQEKIATQKACMAPMQATSFPQFLVELARAAWVILKSNQKYHLKQCLFFVFSWGGIKKLKHQDKSSR